MDCSENIKCIQIVKSYLIFLPIINDISSKFQLIPLCAFFTSLLNTPSFKSRGTHLSVQCAVFEFISIHSHEPNDVWIWHHRTGCTSVQNLLKTFSIIMIYRFLWCFMSFERTVTKTISRVICPIKNYKQMKLIIQCYLTIKLKHPQIIYNKLRNPTIKFYPSN